MGEQFSGADDFSARIDAHRAELLAQARAILGNLEDAEDVVQETFCDAVRDKDKLVSANSLLAWLKSINRCNALSRVRGRSNSSHRLQRRVALEPEKTFTTGGFSILELRETVSHAMETLPPEMREVVRLRYFDHLSYKDIAARLKMPVKTVGSLLFDASIRLYTKLRSRQEALQPEALKAPPVFVSPESEKSPTQQVGGIR